jgi:hypothetical protein
MFLLGSISIGHVKFHTWSALVFGLFFIFTFLKVVGYVHPIYAFMITFVITEFGNNIYETLWQYIVWENGINSYFLQYLIVDFGFIILLFALNYIFKIFKYSNYFFIVLFIEGISFIVLSYTGHYIAMRLWYVSNFTSPDPHNWIWMINKALGVWFLYPIIKSKIKETK